MKYTITDQDYLIAYLASLSITIHIIEASLPTPFLGIKPGLANIIVLLSLFYYGFRVAIWVMLLRVIMGSILMGSFLSPTFLLSFSGALVSLLSIGFIHYTIGSFLSPIGYSVIMAQGHILGQFLVAVTFIMPHPKLGYLLPPLMTMAILFGWISGSITQYILKKLNQ